MLSKPKMQSHVLLSSTPSKSTVKQKRRFSADISYNSDSDGPTRTLSLDKDQNRTRAREVIKSFPKNLTYDGKSHWQAFRMKFTRCAKTCEWTDNEALSCLYWCLVSKTLGYYAVIVGEKETSFYKTLLRKLGERFGEYVLPKTALTRFQNLHRILMNLWRIGLIGCSLWAIRLLGVSLKPMPMSRWWTGPVWACLTEMLVNMWHLRNPLVFCRQYRLSESTTQDMVA